MQPASTVIVLAAKLAKADGAVSREEVRAFKRLFGIDAGEVDDIATIFNEARATPEGFEVYAWQIADLFAQDSAVLEQLLDQLFALAAADGDVDSAELEWLGQVAEIFGFDEDAFAAIVALVHVEAHDPERQDKLVTKAIKNVKWLAGKFETRTVVLHSFAHLATTRAEPIQADAFLEAMRSRLAGSDYSVHTTPFGWFNEFRLHVAGPSLAKVFVEL